MPAHHNGPVSSNVRRHTGHIVILTLKVTLLYGPYATEKWEGTLEVDGKSPLQELHAAIQRILNFDDDHLYELFIARTERSRDKITFDDENGGIYETTINSLYPLPDKRNLYYLFDYGDSWLFKITRARTPEQKAVRKVKYPRLTHESGTRPPQYPSDADSDA